MHRACRPDEGRLTDNLMAITPKVLRAVGAHPAALGVRPTGL